MNAPPYLCDENGYCYPTTMALLEHKNLTAWYGKVAPDGHKVVGTEPPRRWEGLTAVCIASGPSLTEKDCKATQAFPTIAVNNSWRRAPHAQVLMAGDHGWWQQHMHEVKESDFEFWTTSFSAAQDFDVNLLVSRAPTRNSGAKAIELAMQFGVSTILLIGYDCSLKNGVHWHGPHERTSNPVQRDLDEWVENFKWVAQCAEQEGVQIINCSRDTSLTMFERADLEVAISLWQPGQQYNRIAVNRYKEIAVSENPKYMKDASGYCYPATKQMIKRSDMTPWDGAVDANGFAVEKPEPEPKQIRPRAPLKTAAKAGDAQGGEE